jgi:DNA-binding SARP family transcriptional activator
VEATTPVHKLATSSWCLWLRLFHGFRLERWGEPVLVAPTACRLVAYLGLRGRCSRGEVAGVLWPDVPEHRARANLRTALWRLRATDTGGVIPGEEELVLAPTLGVDVARFVTVARDQITACDARPAGAIDALPTLVDAGELLPGWYDDWVLVERERLRQLRLYALEALARRFVAAHQYGEAIETALTAVRLEPLRESATRVLITAHLAEHNMIEAIRRYEMFRADLHRDLRLTPSADLRELLQRALADARSG